MEGSGILNALLTMWMVFPNQAAGLQGLPFVRRGVLAVNNLGIGSGWQQSRQNWMPAAVVGQRIRMESSGLCSVEAVRLHFFFLIPLHYPPTPTHSPLDQFVEVHKALCWQQSFPDGHCL